MDAKNKIESIGTAKEQAVRGIMTLKIPSRSFDIA